MSGTKDHLLDLRPGSQLLRRLQELKRLAEMAARN